MDKCHGLQVASASLLAREGRSLEDNANVLQISFENKVTMVIDCFEIFLKS